MARPTRISTDPVASPPPQYIPPNLRTDPAPPHPDVTERTSRGYEEREVVVPGVDDGPRTIAYGEQWLSGKIQFATKSVFDPSRILYVVELCAGECDALLGVLMPDGSPAPIGASNIAALPRLGPFSVNVWWYPGTATGEVDPNILRSVASWNERFPGTCYAVVELIGFGSYWTQLPNLIFRMRTRKALDPETGLYTYTTNPFVQWYDFLRWSEGKALSQWRINTASFIDAKYIAQPPAEPAVLAPDVLLVEQNDPAEIITTAGQALFESHLLLMEQTDPDDVIKTFRLMTDSMWIWDANQYRVVVDRPRASAATITNRNVVKSKVLDGGRGDVLERPNKVTVWYTDIANGRNLVPVSVVTAALAAGLEDEVEESYRLPGIHDGSIAKSRARYILERRIYDLSLTETWNMTTAALTVGDRVTRDLVERGLLLDATIIGRVKNPDNTFDVTLLEYNEALFTPEIETTPARVPSTLPDIVTPPPNVNPLTFTVTEVFFRESIGTGKTRAKLVWTNPDAPFFERVDIYVALNGGGYQFVSRGTGNATDTVEFLFNNVMELNVPYTFKLVSVSKFGVPSSGTIKPYTFVGKQTVPKDPFGLVGRTVSGEVQLEIQPSDDPDIVGHEVRRVLDADATAVAAPFAATSAEGLNKLWTSASVVRPVLSATELRDPAPYTTWRYLVKAYDGIRYSANPAWTVVTNTPLAAVQTAGLSLSTFTQVLDHGLFARRGTGEAIVDHYGDGSERVMLCRRVTFQDIQNQIDANYGSAGTIGQWAAAHPGPLCFPLQTGVTSEILNSGSTVIIRGSSQRNIEWRFYGKTSQRLGNDRPGVAPFARAVTNGVTGPVYTTSNTFGEQNTNVWGFRLGTNDPYAQEIVHNVDSPATALIQYTQQRKSVTIAGGQLSTDANGNATVMLPLPLADSMCTPIVTFAELASAKVKARLVFVAYDSFSVQTYFTDTGTAAAGVTVYYTVQDVGHGGTLTLITA